jgi:sortase B
MKKRGWNLAASLARAGDRLLNAVIGLLLVTAILYGCFGLFDTWEIYQAAGVDDELLQYKPTGDEDGPNPTLDELRKITEDVWGWLTVDDTNIDYPVVQGETNFTYLNRDVYGEFSLSGSIFLDYRNANDFSDHYSLIYGHHMEGNVMFGELTNFVEDDYFESHSTGKLYTPEHTYSITWFACVETQAYDEMLYRPDAYTDAASQEALLTYIQESATQYRDIGVTASDQLVALSTCYDANTDGRVVLIGRMSLGAQP